MSEELKPAKPRKARKAEATVTDVTVADVTVMEAGVAMAAGETVTMVSAAPAALTEAEPDAPAPEPEPEPEESVAAVAPVHVAATHTPTTTETTIPHKEMTTMDKAIKTAEDFVAFSQGNVEALMKSSQIWAAGVQDLGKHIAASAQAQMDETMATVKALSGVKSIKEAIDLQTSLTKAAVEKAMAETSKLTDATVKLTEETLAPITARVTLATETFTRAV